MAFVAEKVRAAAEAIRRNLLTPREAIRRLLFPKQREFYDAVLDGRLVAALAGRRSGKTSTIIALICLCCGFMGWRVLLVYPNAKQARNRALGKITALAKALGIGVHTRSTDGMVFIGRGCLEIGSAHSRAAIDAIRGDGTNLAIIDEPGTIDEELLCYLMDEVIGPSLLDFGGHWCMAGTPGQVPVGRWWDITGDPTTAWRVVADWTYRDNPGLHDPEATIDTELARAGKTRASDTYQREYMAQWVSADTIRPLHWTPKNDYTALPEGEPVLRILGVDLGWSDSDAIGALYVWRGAVYCLPEGPEDIAPKQTDPQLASKLRVAIKEHRPHIVVGDSAQAKSLANLQAEGIPIIGAKKGRGSVGMGLGNMDSLLRETRMFSKKDSRFTRDAAVIRWKEVGKTLAKKPHSDIIPAMMYALDEVPAPLLLPPPPRLAEPTVFDSPLLRGLLANPNPDGPNYR